jgi:tetratricopeptide (TPR) repeat protein
MVMDADEELEENQAARIIEEFGSGKERQYNTCTFKLKNFTDESHAHFAVRTQPRIFRNNGYFYYSSAVHNQPVYNLPLRNLDITVLHYGYIMTEDIREKKFQRTSTLLKKELEKDPGNIYYRFQLSRSYAMHGDEREALNQAEIYMSALREGGSQSDDNLMYYNNAATIYMINNLYDKALEVCNEALGINEDFIDFIYYKASILFKR